MVTKYIIMCGGEYQHWETPRQLSKICGEEIVARTIRLLRENGIEDISISSNNPVFEKFGIPVLKHDNLYIASGYKSLDGHWFNAFYPIGEPACYIFGDVVFSPEAIKTIVETETDDIEFFGSKPPFTKNYIKTHEEPFALKVVNQKHLRKAIEKTRELEKEGKFWRKPIMWELWTVIKNAPLQEKPGEYTADYVVINDYTCDVDMKDDIMKIEKVLGGMNMIKVEVIKEFTFEKFDEIEKSIVRKGKSEKGKLFKGDVFECTKEIADYLLGNNHKNEIVIKIIEVQPEEKTEEIVLPEAEIKFSEETPKELKATIKTTTKKTTRTKRTKRTKE